jgi:hypothetical protein
LQTKYVTRQTHGLTVLVSYTYSKSLDYGGSAASGGGAAGNRVLHTSMSTSSPMHHIDDWITTLKSAREE